MSTKTVKESRPSKLADAAKELIASASGSSFDAAPFFESFELLAETPKAIERFRQTVLHFAFRGMLTERNGECRDEELLDKVESDVNALAGRKRSQSKRQMVEPTAWPYDLPETWHWTTLGRIANWGSGSTPKRGNPQFYSGSTTWLKSGELNDARDLIGSEETVTDVALKECSFRLNQKGDVLFAMYGATVGKVAILGEAAVTNQAVCGCTPSKFVNNVFLYFYLISQRQTFRDTSEGGAQPNFSKDKIVSFPFPLPPLAEQKRIVAKVDELMGLCDRLEALESERKERHASLSRAALARFADSPTPANLQFLFHNSFYVEPSELRNTILQIAVAGILSGVERSTIESETTDLDSLVAREHPISYGVLKPGPHVPNGIRLVKSQHIRDWRVADDIQDKISHELDAQFKRTKIKGGEVLLNLVGASIGRCAIAPESLRGANVSRAVAVITVAENVDARFMLILLTAAFTPGEIKRLSSGTAQPVLNLGVIRKMQVWLPLLAEQKRIVAKVDKLMALVDQLEQQLAHSRTLGQQLFEAVVAQLTTAPTTSSNSD